LPADELEDFMAGACTVNHAALLNGDEKPSTFIAASHRFPPYLPLLRFPPPPPPLIRNQRIRMPI